MKKVVVMDKLTNIVENKYEAVRVIAKEARRINNIILRSENMATDEKPTILALKRMLEDRIKYDYAEDDSAPSGEMSFDE